MLFSFQFLIKHVLKKCFFSAFGKILVLVNAFSIQTLIKNVLKNCFFSFWQDFGFGKCFFYSNSNYKCNEKLFFSAFGKILVLANAFGKSFFFYSNSK